MNVNECIKLIGFLCDKAQTGNFTPVRGNLAMEFANASLFKRYSGIPETGTSAGVDKMAYSIDSDIEKVMRLFKVSKTLYINDSGFATVPSDFVKESSMNYTYQQGGVTKNSDVDICNDAEFEEKRTSYVVPATVENPACRFIGTTIEFLPKTLVNATMTYLRMPATPVWGYTIVSNRPVYDATASTQPEWPDDIINDFIALACQYMGVNMSKMELVQYTENYKQSGQ